MNYIKYIIFLLLSCNCAFLLNAKEDGGKFKSSFLWNIKECIPETIDNNLSIKLVFEIIDDNIAKNRAVVLQPYIKINNKILDLTPISVYKLDKNNKRPVFAKQGSYASGLKTEVACFAGQKNKIIITDNILSNIKNIDDIDIWILEKELYKDKTIIGRNLKVASFSRGECPTLTLPINFVNPNIEKRTKSQKRIDTFSCSLKYKSNNEDKIYLDYMGNHKILWDFTNTLRSYLDCSFINITSITFKSYTDIDGTINDNKRLAKLRLNDFKSYINKNINQKQKILIRYVDVGEDWTTIEEWLSNSFFSNDESLFNYLKNNTNYDKREKYLLDNYPNLVKDMRGVLYDKLNRFDCIIQYTIKPFNSVKEMINAYKINSKFLNIEDYYLISTEYDTSSYLWTNMALSCVKDYPANPYANMNAVITMFKNNKYFEASKYLRGMGESNEAQYLMAIWYAHNGEVVLAIDVLKNLSPTNDVTLALNQLRLINDWINYKTPWKVKVFSVL